MKITSEAFPSEIRSVRQQLEAWRRTHQHWEPIPEALWNSMAELARKRGVSPISRALRVGYYALQRRVRSNQPANSSEVGDTFLELKVPAPAHPCGCIVELEGRCGRKMTVRLASGADALSLVEAFWRHQR